MKKPSKTTASKKPGLTDCDYFAPKSKIKVANIEIVRIKERTNNGRSTRYAVQCMNCGHDYSITHESIRKRIANKSDRCRVCAQTSDAPPAWWPDIAPPIWKPPGV